MFYNKQLIKELIEHTINKVTGCKGNISRGELVSYIETSFPGAASFWSENLPSLLLVSGKVVKTYPNSSLSIDIRDGILKVMVVEQCCQ